MYIYDSYLIILPSVFQIWESFKKWFHKKDKVINMIIWNIYKRVKSLTDCVAQSLKSKDMMTNYNLSKTRKIKENRFDRII